jgi:hypothetical protein
MVSKIAMGRILALITLTYQKAAYAAWPTFTCHIINPHAWEGLTTNTTGRSWMCNLTCDFKNNVGTITKLSCSGTSPNGAHNLRMCGINGTSAALVTPAGGTYNCH